METAVTVLCSAAALTGIIAGVLFSMSQRDQGLWLSCVTALLLVLSGTCWLQARAWRKDASDQKDRNAAAKAVDSIPDRVVAKLKELQVSHEPELSRKYPLGYTLFSLAGRNQVAHFSKPDSEPILTDWREWSLTIKEADLILRTPDIVVPPNTLILANDFVLPNVIGAYARLPIDSTMSSAGTATVRNTIRGAPPEAAPGITLVVPEGGIAYGNDLGPNSVIAVGKNPTMELRVEILAEGLTGRVLVLGLRRL